MIVASGSRADQRSREKSSSFNAEIIGFLCIAQITRIFPYHSKNYVEKIQRGEGNEKEERRKMLTGYDRQDRQDRQRKSKKEKKGDKENQQNVTPSNGLDIDPIMRRGV